MALQRALTSRRHRLTAGLCCNQYRVENSRVSARHGCTKSLPCPQMDKSLLAHRWTNLKVVHVPFTFAPDPVGGTEIYVEALAHGLRAHGIESLIVAPSSSGIDEA